MQTMRMSVRTTSQARTASFPEVTAADMRARVWHALGQEGFSVVAEIDLADTLNRRLDGVDRPPYLIVEACHPELAAAALSVAPDAGLLVPCRICVWKEGNGTTVATLPPARLVAALDRPHLDEVAAEVEVRLDRVFGGLGRTAPAIPAQRPGSPSTGPALELADLQLLREAALARAQALLAEAAGTESHPLQHELAQTIDKLEAVARKLAPEGTGRPS
jgi:uncharacterized protein (DUF302 family)